MIQFKLYSRTYCHLCDNMLAALHSFLPQHRFQVEVIDVDADEKLLAQYDELVPVLLGKREGDAAPVKLCHYYLDEHILTEFLRGDG
ncbi:MAG: glutaredoxin family protein [Herminiimonas sp.]|nr:glutaredoxin family protein [Herminiimonas sp.]